MRYWCLHYKVFHVDWFKMNLLTNDLTASGQEKLWSYEIRYLSYNVEIRLLNQFEKDCDFPKMRTQSNVLLDLMVVCVLGFLNFHWLYIQSFHWHQLCCYCMVVSSQFRLHKSLQFLCKILVEHFSSKALLIYACLHLFCGWKEYLGNLFMLY